MVPVYIAVVSTSENIWYLCIQIVHRYNVLRYSGTTNVKIILHGVAPYFVAQFGQQSMQRSQASSEW